MHFSNRLFRVVWFGLTGFISLLGLLERSFLSLSLSLPLYLKVHSFLYFSNLILLSFKKCHICLMNPQGNDNAVYSLEMVTCLAFYLVIQFLFGGTGMHDILEFCPFLKFNPPCPPKTCFQLHDHSIDWLSSSTSICPKCSYRYLYRRHRNLKKNLT